MPGRPRSGSSPAGPEAVLAADGNGHGTIIVNLHHHVGLKLTLFHREACGPEQPNEMLYQRSGDLRRGGFGETGTAPLSGIGQKGKLTHHEDLAVDIRKGEVEFAGFIGENAQARNLIGQICRIRFGIPLSNPNENKKPRPDFADGLAINADRGFCHPLDKGFHYSLEDLPFWEAVESDLDSSELLFLRVLEDPLG